MKAAVLSLLMLAIALCLGIAPAHAEKKDNAITSELEPFVKKGTLAGAVVLVASKDGVFCHEVIGSADIAAKKPMRPDSIFWIASMTKPITATALMMLVDEGKLSLDDPVSKHLPEFADMWLVAEKSKDRIVLQKPRQVFTIRHILSHTSGLLPSSRLEPPYDRLSLRDTVRSYTMTHLQSEPGTKWVYSNAGINTAGRIIEVVSKMPYEEFLQKRLFTPLGMKNTTFWPDEKQVARLAKAYRPNKEKKELEETTIAALSYPLSDRKRQPMPAGGLFSTAEDLAKFCQMIANGGAVNNTRFLSEKSVQEMAKNQTGDLPITFGVGWKAGKEEGEPFGHGGAYGTNMTIDPKSGLVMIYMIQHTGGYLGKEREKTLTVFQAAARKRYGK